jgi:hypothetical protein
MSRWLRPSLDTVPHPPDGDNDSVPSECIYRTKKFMLELPIYVGPVLECNAISINKPQFVCILFYYERKFNFTCNASKFNKCNEVKVLESKKKLLRYK